MPRGVTALEILVAEVVREPQAHARLQLRLITGGVRRTILEAYQ